MTLSGHLHAHTHIYCSVCSSSVAVAVGICQERRLSYTVVNARVVNARVEYQWVPTCRYSSLWQVPGDTDSTEHRPGVSVGQTPIDKASVVF